MIAAILLALALISVEPAPVDGRYQSARYAPGVMERVAERRGMRLTGCGIAFDLAPLGSLVWVEGVRTGESRLCMVVDVSHPRDLKRHLQARQVEMDHASARAVCGRWWKDRPRECPVNVTVMRTP